MIDWHSHVLPAMDDGSRDLKESLSMLSSLWEQGVDHVIATPHFYANDESVEEFLKRRSRSYELLKENMSSEMPSVICAAEVRYYSGISRMAELKRLSIEGTNLILIEMPMSKWTEYTLKELITVSGTRGLTVVLAHIERYLAFQNEKAIEKLLDNGIMMQVNASFFNSAYTKRKALRLLGGGKIHFLGSDSHNMKSRPPKIAPAYEIIKKKFGESYVAQINDYGYRVLNNE